MHLFLEEVLAELLRTSTPINPKTIGEAMKTRLDRQHEIAWGYRMRTPQLGQIETEHKLAGELSREVYRRLRS